MELTVNLPSELAHLGVHPDRFGYAVFNYGARMRQCDVCEKSSLPVCSECSEGLQAWEFWCFCPDLQSVVSTWRALNDPSVVKVVRMSELSDWTKVPQY